MSKIKSNYKINSTLDSNSGINNNNELTNNYSSLTKDADGNVVDSKNYPENTTTYTYAANNYPATATYGGTSVLTITYK